MPRAERPQRVLGPRRRHAVAQPRDRAERALLPIVELAARERDRHPDVGERIGMRERRRHHADDVVAAAVELERLADDVGPGGEAAPPEGIAEHDDVAPSRIVVALEQRPAERRRRAQHREVSGRELLADDAFGPIGAGDRERAIPVDLHRVEERGLLPPGVEVEAGALRVAALLAVPGGDPDQAVGVAVGQRRQQDAIDEAEDGEVGADAEGDGGDGGGGEPRTAEEGAKGGADRHDAKKLAHVWLTARV